MLNGLLTVPGTLAGPMGLREVRQAKVLTQRELAARSGVTQKTIADVEGKRVSPHPSTIRKLAAALGIEPEALAAELRRERSS